MADVGWSALRGRPQFVWNRSAWSLSVVIFRWSCASGHGGGNRITVWSYRLGNAMCQSYDTFKRLRFPLASISMPSNTRDRRVSNVLTPRASECKRIRENQFHTTATIVKSIRCARGQ